MNRVIRRKLLPISILMLFVLSVLSANMTGVNALTYSAIYIDPASIGGTDYILGKPFTVALYTNYTNSGPFGTGIRAYEFTLNYDPTILKGVEVTNGDVIVGGSADFIPGTFNDITGKLSLTAALYTEPEWTYEPGILANVTFKPVGIGTSNITIGDETKLVGWSPLPPPGVKTTIIDAVENPNQIGDGLFDNTGANPDFEPPVVVMTASDEEPVNETVVFSGAGSDDPDGGPLSYDWDFGDDTTGTGETVSHTYTTIGIYEVTLVVTDDEGQVSDPATQTITIYERPAYATDLSGKGAWPEHHRHDISRHGANNTLYARVMNLGTETVAAKVVFTVYDGRRGDELFTIETNEATLASLETTTPPLTAEFEAATWGPGKYYLKAQCLYDGLTGAKMKAFTITVVP